jgi:amino acid adenylation domain-containing protein
VEETFVFPTSYSQQRLWFIDQLEPGNSAYNISDTISFTGAFDHSALERALNEMSRRHESLRTTFSSHDGQPMQVVSPPHPRALEVVDFGHLLEDERQSELQRLADAEAARSFKLRTGPLWRAVLVRLSTNEHILLLTVHHIISDAWSMQVMANELETLYDAYSRNEESPLEELPIQYADFAVWQREWLQGEELEEQLKYWRKQLAGMPEVLKLPTDKPRPVILSPNGANQPLLLSQPLTERLKSLSQREGVTLFMTLLAAFKTLLHRYSRQDDVVVGSPVTNRARQELEPLIGFFTNTLVLRTDMSGDPRFSELLGRVKEVCLGAYAHQDLPFEKLVEELQPERSLSHAPLVQVQFQLLSNPAAAEEGREAEEDVAGDDAQDELSVIDATVISEIGIDLYEISGGLFGRIEYSTDLFEHTTVRRMISHFHLLLEAVAAHPEQRLSQLQMMTPAEERQLLIEFNSTDREFPADTCLHQLFESQAERVPEATAIIFENERVSYAELNERANRLAHYLRRQGVGSEIAVAISLQRSVEAIIAILGVLKAGGFCVPLDPDYPQQRLAFMLQDSAASLLLTRREFLPDISDSALRIIQLDVEGEAISAQSSENPESEVSAENLAFVIYTSGSTGQSKGVTLNHQGLVNRLTWGQAAYQMTADDRVLQFFSYCFDFAVWEVFTALVVGAGLVLARPKGQQDASYLVRLMAEQKVSILGCVPSMFDVMLDEPEIRQCSSLRKVMCGGEVLPVEFQERFLERLPHAELQNTYGPTEASIDVTCWVCRTEDEQQIVPLGHPVANTQLYLLDAYLRPVPIGIPGELYIGGVSLARGYLNRPALTAERFVPNPFGTPGARLYRTGDLARYRMDGAVEFLGRLDQQVKIRGFRIEPGEIEAALSNHPSVREAVVVARDGAAEGKRLVAYLVASSNGEPHNGELPGELRRFLRERLPEYMIPSAFVQLETLPLTPNGKVNRRALPEPAEAFFNTSYVAPRTEMERTIAEIWQELFGVGQISVDSNFFELGGHSLIMVRVQSRLREALRREIPLIDLFRYPTISSLAKSLSGEETADANASEIINERAGRQRAAAANRHKQAVSWRTKAHG